MNDLLVRTAVITDLDVLLKFEQALIEAERPFDPLIRTDDEVHYYDLEYLIGFPDAEVVVAELDGYIIGSGYALIQSSKAYLRHRHHSYLGFMYVAPEHRGKGVNKKDPRCVRKLVGLERHHGNAVGSLCSKRRRDQGI